MIFSKYYNSLDKDKKEDFVAGLVFGLVWGLVWGLVFGLVAGLVFGLVWGLVAGLVFGLVWGLVFGLVFGLVWGLVVLLTNFGEAFPFLHSLFPILLLVFFIILISEFLFWLMPKENIKKGVSVFWFTAKRKAESVLEVVLGLGAVGQFYVLLREIRVRDYLPIILKWVGYIGFGVIILVVIVGLFYVWIKANSRKYEGGKNV